MAKSDEPKFIILRVSPEELRTLSGALDFLEDDGMIGHRGTTEESYASVSTQVSNRLKEYESDFG